MAKKKNTKKTKKTASAKPKTNPAKKKLSKKKQPAPKKPAVKKTKKKSAVKKTSVKTRPVSSKKKPVAKKAGAKKARSRKPAQSRDQSSNIRSFPSDDVRARSAGQSGGLQQLSDAASADSESVDELIEEGNAFEAGVVSGVEAADSADEEEVHTHEVPEDDVPGEYLDDEDEK